MDIMANLKVPTSFASSFKKSCCER
jgi:hypothetical protein